MYLLLSPTGPIALLEGICRFVPSLVRIDPGAVELPADEPTAAGGVGSKPETQSYTSGGSTSGDSNGRGVAYSLEWREFKSVAAAAGLSSAEEAKAEAKARVEAEAEVNAEGLDDVKVKGEGEVKGEGSPAARNTDTSGDIRQPAMTFGRVSSISGAVESDASTGEPLENLACVNVGGMATEVGGGAELETSMETETEMEVDKAGAALVKA